MRTNKFPLCFSFRIDGPEEREMATQPGDKRRQFEPWKEELFGDKQNNFSENGSLKTDDSSYGKKDCLAREEQFFRK